MKSKPGIGSEFYFILLLPAAEEIPLHDKKQDEDWEILLEGLHVLLVEDNDINAEIVMELLKSQNVIVNRAAGGGIICK